MPPIAAGSTLRKLAQGLAGDRCQLPGRRYGRSFGQLPVGQAYFLDVEPGLDLAKDGVVDAAFVAEPDEGGALAGEQRETQFGVLLLQAQCEGAVAAVGVQDQQVRLVLGAERRRWARAATGGGYAI
jgi:hypothetical protein